MCKKGKIMRLRKISLVVLSIFVCACSHVQKEMEPSEAGPKQTSTLYDRTGIVKKELAFKFFKYTVTDVNITEKIFGASEDEYNDLGERIAPLYRSSPKQQLLITSYASDGLIDGTVYVYDIKTDSYFSLVAYEGTKQINNSVYFDGAYIYAEAIKDAPQLDIYTEVVEVKLFRDGETKTLTSNGIGAPGFYNIDNVIYFGRKWFENQDDELRICSGISKIVNDEEIQITKFCSDKIVGSWREDNSFEYMGATGSYKHYFYYLSYTQGSEKAAVNLYNTRDGSIKTYPFIRKENSVLGIAFSNDYLIIGTNLDRTSHCKYSSIHIETNKTLDYSVDACYSFSQMSDQFIYASSRSQYRISLIEINDLGEMIIYESQDESLGYFIPISDDSYIEKGFENIYYISRAPR